MKSATILAAVVAALRLLTLLPSDHRFSEWQTSNVVELLASFVFLLILVGNPFRKIAAALAVLMLATLAGFSWRQRAETVGALILVHNFVGWYYWLALAKTRSMRVVALVTLALFSGITAGILGGAFDQIIMTFNDLGQAKTLQLPFAGLSIFDVGPSLFPNENEVEIFMRGIVAYAFGQSVHYFVWLRAIPEAHNTSKVPISWRHTWRALREEAGTSGACVYAFGLVAATCVWILAKCPTARLIYFCLAAMHGYLEIMGVFSHLGRRAEQALRPGQVHAA